MKKCRFQLLFLVVEKKLKKYLLLKIKAISLRCQSIREKMKYSELHKLLRKIGCCELDKQMGGHPLWYSPITGKKFKTSNHLSQEVKPGTLKSIKRDAGL
jgi:YcfA-like protein.